MVSSEKKEVKKINGLYISTDGKQIETKNGTENDFMELLRESISEYLIDDDYKILYNKKSNESANKFISFFQFVNINGPIIFVNDKKRILNVFRIRQVLKKKQKLFLTLTNSH